MVEVRKSRLSGTQILMGRADELALCDGGGYTKWYTICEDHGVTLGHPTKFLAMRHRAYSVEWCDGCREEQ